MTAPTDAATEEFLTALATDFDRQLGRSANLEGLRLEVDGRDTVVVATLHVGARSICLEGRGENAIAAYADLCRYAPAPVLAAAFREYVTH